MINVVAFGRSFLVKGDSWEMEEGANGLVLNVTRGEDDVVIATFRHWDYVMLVDDAEERPIEDLELPAEVIQGIDDFIKDPSSGVLYDRKAREARKVA